jgi:hypothetical protein
MTKTTESLTLWNLRTSQIKSGGQNSRLEDMSGLVPSLIEGGLTHLQYADDTIIFLNFDDQSIYSTKFLLYCFEDMSGLKINYEKVRFSS